MPWKQIPWTCAPWRPTPVIARTLPSWGRRPRSRCAPSAPTISALSPSSYTRTTTVASACRPGRPQCHLPGTPSSRTAGLCATTTATGWWAPTSRSTRSGALMGARSRFCNLGAWCVLRSPAHGLRLLRALLPQRGITSRTCRRAAMSSGFNTRLRFTSLDTTTALVPEPSAAPPAGGAGRISDPGRSRNNSRGTSGRCTRTTSARPPHVTHPHPGRRRRAGSCSAGTGVGLPLFASLIYVSNPDLFRARPMAGRRHLLLRHRIPFTLVELRRRATPRPRHAPLAEAEDVP